MRLPRDPLVPAAATAAFLVAGALLGAATGSRGILAAGAVLACLPHALLLAAAPGARRDRGIGAALAVAAVVGLALVGSGAPALSDDVHRYLWDGRVLRAGLDPFRHAPADPALAGLRDAHWARVNHPEVATIYPPLAQLAFAVVGGAWHDPRAFRLAALAAHLAAALVAARLAGPDRAVRVAWLVALHPLALLESAGSGHLDAGVGLALAAVALGLARGRPGLAGLAGAAAVGLKLVGLVAAPLLWRRSRAAVALVLVAGAASLAPLAGAGGGSRQPGGLTQYATRWRGNAGPYEAVEALCGRALASLRDGDDLRRPGGGLVVLPDRLRGGAADPLRTVRPPKKEPVRAVPWALAVGLVARALAAALALGVAVVAARRASTPALALRAAVLGVLLLAPQVHPWYLLWLLPLEVATGRAAGLVWAAAVLGAYAAADAWVGARVWAEAPGFRLAEYALVMATLSGEALAPYLARARAAELTHRASGT